jgi:hypothetical protein
MYLCYTVRTRRCSVCIAFGSERTPLTGVVTCRHTLDAEMGPCGTVLRWCCLSLAQDYYVMLCYVGVGQSLGVRRVGAPGMPALGHAQWKALIEVAEVGTRSAAVTRTDGEGRGATEGKQGRSESTLSKERTARGPADTHTCYAHNNYAGRAKDRGPGVCTVVYRTWVWTCVVARRGPGTLAVCQREREGADFVTPP